MVASGKGGATGLLRFARGAMRFVAGLLIGGGMLLYGQVQFADLMRQRVEDTFFLWVEIGHATFFLQGKDVQVALLLSTIEEDYYAHTEKVALTLGVLGGCLLFTSFFLHPRRRKRRG